MDTINKMEKIECDEKDRPKVYLSKIIQTNFLELVLNNFVCGHPNTTKKLEIYFFQGTDQNYKC